MSGTNSSGSVSDASYNTRMSNQAQIGTALVKAITALTAAINTVAIIPAPSAGAVGTYVMATCSAAVAFGAMVPATDLVPSNAAGTGTGGTLAGEWMCMGHITTAGNVSLFVRVS